MHRHQNNWQFTMTWEAGWRYGIISTVPYEQQKIYRQIILFQRIYYLSISLTGLPCHREPSIVLMSMLQNKNFHSSNNSPCSRVRSGMWKCRQGLEIHVAATQDDSCFFDLRVQLLELVDSCIHSCTRGSLNHNLRDTAVKIAIQQQILTFFC